MKKHEYTSAAVASKAARLLSQASALLAAVDLVEQAARSLRKVAEQQYKIAKSLAGTAMTQAPPRSADP